MCPEEKPAEDARAERATESPDHITAAVATLAHEAFKGCDSASITVVERGHPHTAAATHDAALAIDEQQYDSGDGPCLTAIRIQQVVRVDSFTADDRWPAVANAATRHGVHSSLSLPLVTEGRARGALNLYSTSDGGFQESEDVGAVFAPPAAVAVAGAAALNEATELAHHLARALEHRDLIGQAKGILMATSGVSADEAFAMLTAASQRENRKLYVIAEEIVSKRAKGE